MRVADFRQIALSLPEAMEGSHFGHADFRVGGKIFATLGLAKQGYGVLLLSPDEQAGMVEDAPDIFSPVPGGWGRQGSTRVRLAKVAPDILEAALRMAWRRRAPKHLLQAAPIPEASSARDRAARRQNKRRPMSRNRPAKTAT